MDEATARARLERMVAHDTAPTLSEDDIDDLLLVARRPDVDGLAIDDDNWIPTWDLHAAAAAGWETKMGRAVTFDFSEDGQSFDRSQVMKQCEQMANRYRRGSGSIRIASGFMDDLAAVTPDWPLDLAG